MKVTKLIREYIEEKVSKAYDSRVNPYSERAAEDREALEAFGKDLIRQQQELLDEFTKRYELFYRYRDNSRVTKISACCPGVSGYDTKAMRDELEWRNENIRVKNRKIREIVVNLELGATRKELDEMLENMLAEVQDSN